MRKINTRDFHVATRTTSRDINRRIALNLIREHQPISRADLARRMNVTRGVVSVLVQELINQKVIYEGATGEAMRGRKPTFLHIQTQNRLAIAVDVRFSRTYLMLCDFSGQQLALETYDTIFSIPAFVKDLASRIRRIVKHNGFQTPCEGVGLVVPGMVDQRTGRILNAPLNLEGPRCLCGARGCWEAYTSNLATLSRYFGWNLSKLNPKSMVSSDQSTFTILELIGRARNDDAKAVNALQDSAHFLGLGLATIVNVINPDCIYLSGEITTAWDLIENTVRKAMTERTLTEAAAQTPLRVTAAQEYPRLRGAAALIAAPTFAAPRVA